MTNNINPSDLVTIVETYGIVPLRSTANITAIVNNSGTYTFTVSDVTTLAAGDNVQLTDLTNFDFKVRVLTVGVDNFTASKKFVAGTGWVDMGTIAIIDESGSYTRLNPYFFRGDFQALNRLLDNKSPNIEHTWPLIFMANYHYANQTFNQETFTFDVEFPQIEFGVVDQAKESTYADDYDLFDAKWDTLNNMAMEFIENLGQFENTKATSDQRTLFLPTNSVKFDNFKIYGDDSVIIDSKLIACIFQLPLKISNARSICS